MSKDLVLELIKLLSALESWGFASGNRMPDYLQERLCDVVDSLCKEILK